MQNQTYTVSFTLAGESFAWSCTACSSDAAYELWLKQAPYEAVFIGVS
jgi:hypothetical protein